MQSLPTASSLVSETRTPVGTVRLADSYGQRESADSGSTRPSVGELPAYRQANKPAFAWGEVDGATFVEMIREAYAEVVHWRRNIFLVPSGDAGKAFTEELARLFRSYADNTALECVSLTAAMLMPVLLLQKPFSEAKAKDHVACLKRRMVAWKAGEISSLLTEGRAIQKRLRSLASTVKKDDGALRGFTRLMLLGNIAGALRLLSSTGASAGVLPLSDTITGSDGTARTVRDILRDKHPGAAPATSASLLPSAIDPLASHASSPFHPVMFDQITGDLIRNAALRTEGSAGPSGIDAAGWRRLCSSFHGASASLCNAVAAVTHRLCTSYVDPSPLSALIACRLIPLDKRPGVRPIGVCETVRRIMGKAIMRVVRQDVREAVGPLQLCAGQPAGCEVAVHAMAEIFRDAGTDAVLLVDASNAFNSVNRAAALLNIRTLCPALAPFLTNIYRDSAQLFVGGETIWSQEGTTQGDPLAMAMFAIAIRPLIDKVAACGTFQVWFADDAAAGASITAVRRWWDMLRELGPAFGYHVNSSKTWLLVKPEMEHAAERAFAGTGVNVTMRGVSHLGAPLGEPAFIEEMTASKVCRWVEDLTKLSDFALSQPHLAFCALTQGLASRWTYHSRTTGAIHHLLAPLEKFLQERFIPSITGRPACSDELRSVMSLPCRLGGLGICNPVRRAAAEHSLSQRVCRSVVDMIRAQRESSGATDNLEEALARQKNTIAEVKKEQRVRLQSSAGDICADLPAPLQRAVRLAQEPGASTWLSARPVQEHGFALHKGAFRDAMALRYGWEPKTLPSHCACGDHFTVSHALSCAKGGFVALRHNEVRDLTAGLLTEVSHDVETEPELQPLDGEVFQHRSTRTDACARLDIKASGFWGGRFECAFFDVRIFNPLAHSNHPASGSLASVYRKHEVEKRRHYQQRVTDIEMASFTPLVFAATGGCGPAAATTIKRMAALLANKWAMPYAAVMGWLRCRYGFSIIRSAIMCLRGSRSFARYCGIRRPDVAIAEGRVGV